MANLTAEQLERLTFALESDNHHDILFALGLGSNANQKPIRRPKRQPKAKPTPKEASGFLTYTAFCLALMLIMWACSIIYSDFHAAKPTPERVERKGGKRT